MARTKDVELSGRDERSRGDRDRDRGRDRDRDRDRRSADKKKKRKKKKGGSRPNSARRPAASGGDAGPAKSSSGQNLAADAEAGGDGPTIHKRMRFKTWMKVVFFVADAWLAHIGWTVMYGFIWSLFWHQVDPTDSSLPVIFSIFFFLGLMALPWVLEVPRVMRAVDVNLDYLTLVTPACFLLALIPVAPLRTAVMALGAVVQFANIGLIWSRPSTDFRTQSFRYAMPIGLLLLLIVRWNQASINPLFNADQLGVAALIGITGFAACAIVIATQRLAYFNNQQVVFHTNPDLDYDHESETRKPLCGRPWSGWFLLVGISYSSFLFVVMWLFTSTAAVTRWAGLHPYPYGVVIIGMLALGVLLLHALERYTDAISTNGLEMEPPLWLIAGDAALVNAGCGMMVHGTDAPTVMVGGSLVALLIPLTFFLVLKDLAFLRAHRSVARAIGTGAILYCVYGFMQLGVLVGGEGTIFGDFHNKPAAALWLMSIGSFVSPLGMWLRRHLTWEAWHPLPKGLSRTVDFRVVLPSIGICLFVFLLPWLVIRPKTWAQHAPPASNGTLSVASMNVLRGYRSNGLINVDRVLEAVEDSDWGVVALQESDAVGPAYGNRDLVGYWMYYLNTREYYGLNPRGQTFGCAYLTHYHMTGTRTSVLYSKTDCEDCPPPNRVLVRGEVTFDGEQVAVYNTQLEDLKLEATTRQAAEVAAIITADIASGLTDRFVLVGDFQVAPDRTVGDGSDDTVLAPLFAIDGVKHAYEEFNNCTHVAEADPSRAVCADYRTETVDNLATDHIFVRGLDVREALVREDISGISDHLPLTARLVLSA